MKKVIFDKETDTINASKCHENDGKIYVVVIDGEPYILAQATTTNDFIWLELNNMLNGVYFGKLNDIGWTFKEAVNEYSNKKYNLTQLNNLSELGKWLIELNQQPKGE